MNDNSQETLALSVLTSTERMRRWRKANPERSKAIARTSAARIRFNVERLLKRRASFRRYYHKNRAFCLAAHDRWKEKNPWAKIADSARSLVRMTVHGTLKGGPKFKALVGMDGMQFRLHLQSLWLPGMSWLNFGRGGWTIGHIKPVLSFKDSIHTQEGLSACFHFSNLQPEWEEVNNFKHSNTSLSPVQLVVTNQIRKSMSEREKEPTKRHGHPGQYPKPPLPLFVADAPAAI